MSHSEVQALAALRNAPLGLVSARAVARRSGLSPTAAAAALRSLLEKGLVTRRRETIAAGRAREEQIWHANRANSHWAALDPALGKTRRPQRQKPTSTPGRVPSYLLHLFWNTADAQLDVGTAGPYIARRLLRTMDLQGLAWGAIALSPQDWRAGSRARGLDPSVKQLARNLAGAARSLAGVFSATKIEIFDASDLRLLAKPVLVAGLRISSLQDLMAMKLKVMAERGEMRDYFDVKTIDEAGDVSVEEGVDLYMARYGISPQSEAIPHLFRAMGDLSDVDADESVPISKRSLQKWWSQRQVEVIRNSNRFA